jgi:hypothetical protein
LRRPLLAAHLLRALTHGAGRAPTAPSLLTHGAGKAPTAPSLLTHGAGRAPTAPSLLAAELARAFCHALGLLQAVRFCRCRFSPTGDLDVVNYKGLLKLNLTLLQAEAPATPGPPPVDETVLQGVVELVCLLSHSAEGVGDAAEQVRLNT